MVFDSSFIIFSIIIIIIINITIMHRKLTIIIIIIIVIIIMNTIVLVNIMYNVAMNIIARVIFSKSRVTCITIIVNIDITKVSMNKIWLE